MVKPMHGSNILVLHATRKDNHRHYHTIKASITNVLSSPQPNRFYPKSPLLKNSILIPYEQVVARCESKIQFRFSSRTGRILLVQEQLKTQSIVQLQREHQEKKVLNDHKSSTKRSHSWKQFPRQTKHKILRG